VNDVIVSHDRASSHRGTIAFVHGLGEHSGRYRRLAGELRNDGWSSLTYDLHGHGRSPAKRGVLPRDTTLLEELAGVLDSVDRRPLVLFGHSMGGLIAGRFVAEGLAERPAAWCRSVDALVMSSPALTRTLTWSERIRLAIGGRLTPDLAVSNGLDSSKISHDPEVVRAYQTDPLVHDRVTPRLARFILDSGKLVRELAPRWEVPTLLLWAGDDALVDPRGSEEFAAAAPRAVVHAAMFPGLYHEIFNEAEPARTQVVASLREWLDERFPR
jgi:alpha-beta hydrolase superfamily lysophospholipase